MKQILRDIMSTSYYSTMWQVEILQLTLRQKSIKLNMAACDSLHIFSITDRSFNLFSKLISSFLWQNIMWWMYYHCEWVKVRESVRAEIEEAPLLSQIWQEWIERNKKKAKHMFPRVTWLILRKWLSLIIHKESEGRLWAMTLINPNLGPKCSVSMNAAEEDWQTRRNYHKDDANAPCPRKP